MEVKYYTYKSHSHQGEGVDYTGCLQPEVEILVKIILEFFPLHSPVLSCPWVMSYFICAFSSLYKMPLFKMIIHWLCQVLFAALRIFTLCWSTCDLSAATCELLVTACKLLASGVWDPVSWPGRPPTLGAQSLSHWTTREVPTKASWTAPVRGPTGFSKPM